MDPALVVILIFVGVLAIYLLSVAWPWLFMPLF